jgi:hypothetical protein
MIRLKVKRIATLRKVRELRARSWVLSESAHVALKKLNRLKLKELRGE